MRLFKGLALALILMCSAAASFGQAEFQNNDGTFTSTGDDKGATLSLASSQLVGVSGLYSGLGTGLNCGTPPESVCSGTLSLTTGALESTVNIATLKSVTATLLPSTSEVSTFGSGGAFMVTESGGLTFSGTFAPGATWSCTGTCAWNTKNTAITGIWTLNGTLADDMLTINGQQFQIQGAATVQLTTAGTKGTGVTVTPGKNGIFTIKDSGGSTSFASPVPEPGTLSMFGTGLIAIGMLTKRHLSKRGSPAS
jgi:hypothetical protein